MLCHDILPLPNESSQHPPILFQIHFNIMLLATLVFLKHLDNEMKPTNAYKHFKVYNII